METCRTDGSVKQGINFNDKRSDLGQTDYQ